MNMPRSLADLKNMLAPAGNAASQSPATSLGGMDRAIARKPRWRRYAIFAALAILAGGAGVWALRGAGGNVYRVPVNRLTIGTVTHGPFEDYIAVRGAVAPFIIDYLTTDQGGTVKQVLVEDGATVKSGQPLIILSNPALQLQVAAQQSLPVQPAQDDIRVRNGGFRTATAIGRRARIGSSARKRRRSSAISLAVS